MSWVGHCCVRAWQAFLFGSSKFRSEVELGRGQKLFREREGRGRGQFSPLPCPYQVYLDPVLLRILRKIAWDSNRNGRPVDCTCQVVWVSAAQVDALHCGWRHALETPPQVIYSICERLVRRAHQHRLVDLKMYVLGISRNCSNVARGRPQALAIAGVRTLDEIPTEIDRSFYTLRVRYHCLWEGWSCQHEIRFEEPKISNGTMQSNLPPIFHFPGNFSALPSRRGRRQQLWLCPHGLLATQKCRY